MACGLSEWSSLDFGNSFASHQKPVLWERTDKSGNVTKGLIQESLPITLMINLLGICIIFSISIFLGTLSAVRQNTWVDRSITLFVFIGFAIPGFWLALLLMYWTGVSNQWLPISGLHSLGYQNLSSFGSIYRPSKTLNSSSFNIIPKWPCWYILYVRNGMLDILHQDFITTARSKGLKEE